MGWSDESMAKSLQDIAKYLQSIDRSLKTIANGDSSMSMQEFYEDHQSKLPKGYPSSTKETK